MDRTHDERHGCNNIPHFSAEKLRDKRCRKISLGQMIAFWGGFSTTGVFLIEELIRIRDDSTNINFMEKKSLR